VRITSSENGQFVWTILRQFNGRHEYGPYGLRKYLIWSTGR